MTDLTSQSNSTIADDLLAVTERINQALPAIRVELPQSGIALTPEQFDSLIASW